MLLLVGCASEKQQDNKVRTAETIPKLEVVNDSTLRMAEDSNKVQFNQ